MDNIFKALTHVQ